MQNAGVTPVSRPMSRTAHFRVDPNLAHVLGESYASSEKALKELVDNAVQSKKAEGKMKKYRPSKADSLLHSSF